MVSAVFTLNRSVGLRFADVTTGIIDDLLAAPIPLIVIFGALQEPRVAGPSRSGLWVTFMADDPGPGDQLTCDCEEERPGLQS
jgi:hypothetical protein